jgi:Ca-activated chloride channel homolog
MIREIGCHNFFIRFTIIAFLMASVALLSHPSQAQSGRRPLPRTDAPSFSGTEKGEDSPLLRVKTSEVLLPVTVRNQFGHLASGLAARDFIVVEDGVRQEIASFNVREVPINVVLLLDASGSVFTEMKQIRESAINFVEQLRPGDRISVIQFADKVELIQDWTSKADDLRHAISWRYRSGKSTHLWDAIFLAADESLSRVEGRKAIIILTDGDDTESKITREQAYAATVRSGASVYIVSQAQALANKLQKEYGGTGGRIAGTKKQADQITNHLKQSEAVMRDFAEKTGGHLYSPAKSEDLNDAYLQVAEELKNQYLITYLPTNDRRDGSFRNIQVLLTRTGLLVNTKEGYIAPKE